MAGQYRVSCRRAKTASWFQRAECHEGPANPSLASAIAEALRPRHVPPRTATLTAQAAVAVFTIAYADWIDNCTEDFDTLMQRSLAEFRQAVGSMSG